MRTKSPLFTFLTKRSNQNGSRKLGEEFVWSLVLICRRCFSLKGIFSLLLHCCVSELLHNRQSRRQLLKKSYQENASIKILGCSLLPALVIVRTKVCATGNRPLVFIVHQHYQCYSYQQPGFVDRAGVMNSLTIVLQRIYPPTGLGRFDYRPLWRAVFGLLEQENLADELRGLQNNGLLHLIYPRTKSRGSTMFHQG